MMDRRKFLTSLAATFTAAAITPAMASEQSPFSGFNQIADQALKDGDVLLVGDGEHSITDLMDPLNDPEFLAIAKKNNVTDIFIELPNEFQQFLNDVADGGVSPKAFARRVSAYHDKVYRQSTGKTPLQGDGSYEKRLEKIGQLIINAKAQGIDVHASDPQPPAEGAILREKLSSSDPDEQLAGVRGAVDRINDYDPQIAAYVKSKSRGKSIVFYGYVHALGTFQPITRTFLGQELKNQDLKVTSVYMMGGLLSAEKAQIIDALNSKDFQGMKPNYIYEPRINNTEVLINPTISPVIPQPRRQDRMPGISGT